MIQLTEPTIFGLEETVRGMRNPYNSWSRSDSGYQNGKFVVGENDYQLMLKLADAGTDHGKLLRFITVYVDITAPLYWWKEFDTYRIGVEKNSCSTMHNIADKEFTLNDFSHEHLGDICINSLQATITSLNAARTFYLYKKEQREDAKDYWWDMIQLLPSSYNQKRTVMMSYAALRNMYKSRKNHRLDEWLEFCKFIRKLPYSELITGEEN